MKMTPLSRLSNMAVKQKTYADGLVAGHRIGFEKGRQEALIEFQKENPNKDLPSNEILYKIIKLLYECEENDRKSSSVYMNNVEHVANYITKNWNKNK